ncbi:response regulator transcription factor [Eisenbergiella porci]|uniref:response regulator transcription factor n=1 Tax=Eisenbergiella porci TaxID=2652274 RepID=UPI002A80AE57|nr:response regulator transcription factor [Eisenbergiella porci]
MKILIIEDERPINNLIRSTLTADGYSCDCAFDGKEGADLIEQRQYDLILLDLMLPEISGYDLLEYIRSLGNIRAAQIPVIIISAMGQVQDRIRGLHLGADDYLCKPFQIGELAARVEAVLRRSGHSNEKIRIGDVLISPASRQVWKAGTPVELTVKEFDLLAELARHKNVVLSREKLYETVWQEEYTGETRTLDSHIQKLRKKLGWNGQIKTVFRIGYRLEELEQ